MRLRKRIRGLGLLEILVSTAVLAIGIVSTFKCLGAMAEAQRRTLAEETMQRLAVQTLDKIIAEQTLTAGQEDGDFLDQGESRYIWHAEREPVSGGNLDIVRVEVGPKEDNYQHAQKIQGLFCRPSKGTGS